jgi:hypothetical protein
MTISIVLPHILIAIPLHTPEAYLAIIISNELLFMI